MTNNSIFTRVLALMICLVMLVGTLTACFNEVDGENHTGTTTNGEVTTKPTTTTTTTTTTGDVVEDEPTEDPVDPNVIFSASTNITSDSLIYGTLASDVVIGGAEMGALVPADVKVEAGASNLALSVKKVDEVLLSDTLSALDVHINGVALDNTVPMIVKLGAILEAGLGATELKLYHTENGVDNLMTRVNSPADFAIHNQYYYNAETGEVTIYIASFSVISAVKSVADVWDGTSVAEGFASGTGTEADPFIIETAAQLVYFRNQVDAGVTYKDQFVKLGADIDLDKKPFDPIGFGYYDNDDSDGKTNYRVFMGTFDGGNHTIYNLYENCWELDPNPGVYDTYTYSTAGAGLFASVKDATIQNIAINGAEVVFECVDMGVLVGYAQGECHFENIVISNAKIANYNRYTGGLVGEVSYGVNNEDGYSHTFKNITIDSTVTVSGLWGSFGCGMGGVIGGKWGESKVLMENVVSAPVMDVYNDVVSAYQWYAFRGCGMLIGHTEEPYSDGRTSGNATASFLTCKNVNVYYGDWVDYNYYEFENQDNTTGQRYPWVRAEEGEYCEAFSNIRYGVPTHTVEGVTTAVSELSPEELEKVATDHVVITFDQLYGADRGMYGTNEHEGVNISYSSPKTFYIKNNVGWENLTLHYTYEIGEETWTTIPDGVELVEFNGVYRIDLPVGAKSFIITADGDYTSKEFIVSELTEKETYPVHEHNFESNNECTCGAQKITASVTISEYAAANGWVNGTQYPTIDMGNGITVTATEKGNTGKYYESGENWRLYQTDGDVTLVINSKSGNILSVRITYLNENTGTLVYDGTNIASDVVVYANSGLITFTLGNTGSATNGQVRITAIEVVYVVENHDCVYSEATCTTKATCTICGATTGEFADHNWNDATCEAPKTCSVCGETEGEALSHTTENGVCENCGEQIGGTVEPETPTSNRYYIATKRTEGNYWYMTSNLGTASTKRYTAVDSGLTVLPESIATPEEGYVFVLVDNGDGTYSIRAEGVDGNNYLGWTSGNSGTLVAKESAIKFTLVVNNGVYNIHFAASDAERYLALNGTSGNNYFAWYKSGQKQDLILIPVVGGDNGGNEGGETPEPEHICESKCATCGKCTDDACEESVCADKCKGHTPTLTESTISINFANISAGTQYADETKKINDDITISTHNKGCHFTTQLRIYDSSTNNGYAVIESTGVVTELKFNMGYKKCTLNVYGSVDGVTWVIISGVATTSTSYLDYALDVDESLGYKYIKLDASGAQIRIASIDVTIIE